MQISCITRVVEKYVLSLNTFKIKQNKIYCIPLLSLIVSRRREWGLELAVCSLHLVVVSWALSSGTDKQLFLSDRSFIGLVTESFVDKYCSLHSGVVIPSGTDCWVLLTCSVSSFSSSLS